MNTDRMRSHVLKCNDHCVINLSLDGRTQQTCKNEMDPQRSFGVWHSTKPVSTKVMVRVTVEKHAPVIINKR